MGLVKQIKTIRIDSEILNTIEDYAKNENRSVSNLIETVLKQYVKKRRKTENKKKV